MVNNFFKGIMQIMSIQIRISKTDLVIFGGGAAAVVLANSPRARKGVAEFAEGFLSASLKQSQDQPALPAPQPLVLPAPPEISLADPLSSSTPLVAYTPEPDEALAQLVRHPSLVIIIGHRGSGKRPWRSESKNC